MSPFIPTSHGVQLGSTARVISARISESLSSFSFLSRTYSTYSVTCLGQHSDQCYWELPRIGVPDDAFYGLIMDYSQLKGNHANAIRQADRREADMAIAILLSNRPNISGLESCPCVVLWRPHRDLPNASQIAENGTNIRDSCRTPGSVVAAQDNAVRVVGSSNLLASLLEPQHGTIKEKGCPPEADPGRVCDDKSGSCKLERTLAGETRWR